MRAEDLVFIHSNMRLLSKNSDEYSKGRNRMWDVGGDSFDGVGILELADLSLDKPELEVMLFEDGEF